MKGIDIRIKPPKDEPKPEEIQCDWAGCVQLGGCKAPKSPDRLREYYNFCAKHAREYNKNWNFFSEMNDEEMREFQKGVQHGHRPTWDMRKNTTEKAKANGKAKAGFSSFYSDDFGLFDEQARSTARPERNGRRLTKLQVQALTDLGLEDTAEKKQIREQYTRLVKQLHPDTNGGDRTTEDALQRVVKAWQILKTTNLV